MITVVFTDSPAPGKYLQDPADYPQSIGKSVYVETGIFPPFLDKAGTFFSSSN